MIPTMLSFAAGPAPGTTAETDGHRHPFDAFHDLIVHIDGEIGRPPIIVLARTCGSTNRHKCGSSTCTMETPSSRQQLNLAPQDWHAVADTNRLDWDTPSCDLTGSHIRSPSKAGLARCLESPAGELFQKRDFAGNEPWLLGRQAIDDHGPGSPIGRIQAELEAMCQLGDDADIALAPPFAVGDDVQTGGFLQCHRGADGLAH